MCVHHVVVSTKGIQIIKFCICKEIASVIRKADCVEHTNSSTLCGEDSQHFINIYVLQFHKLVTLTKQILNTLPFGVGYGQIALLR
jgi:hypothetical protein